MWGTLSVSTVSSEYSVDFAFVIREQMDIEEEASTLNLDDMGDVEDVDPSDGVLGVGITKPPRNTSKHPLPASCELKRSSLGRTQLFLNGINYSDVRCSASITQHIQRNSLFHPHRQNGRLPEVFTKPCDIACWHCCHSFSTPPIPVPKDYQAAEGVYYVFGCFCSLSCGKAYLLETPTFNTGLSVMLLAKMGREIYNEPNIQTAPPRLSLDIFGGPYSINAFRNQKNEVITHVPPFVSTYMVCEERTQAHDSMAAGVDLGASVRGLRRPTNAAKNTPNTPTSAAAPGASLYSKYVVERTGESQPQRTEKANTVTSTLSQFMKK